MIEEAADTATRGPELGRSLRLHRREVADAFALAFDTTSKWRLVAATPGLTRDDYVEEHFRAFADYLIEFFDHGDAAFKHLLVGELIKGLYVREFDESQAHAQGVMVLASLREHLSSVFESKQSSTWAPLDRHLGEIERILLADIVTTQRVLLVGDCIFLDIIPFIVAELLGAGIKLVPDYATSKNPPELRDELRALSNKKFDLVLFSPFTYGFSPAYAQLGHWRRALISGTDIHELVQETWSETRSTIDLMANLFDCPIHVHNSAAIIREESGVKRAIKLKATAKIRKSAKRQMNALLASHLEQKNAESFRHLFLFDEDRIVQQAGEQAAGAFFYKTRLQHPAMLGRMLAQDYVDLIFVNAKLLKKKVVVCDLDNTLWDGLIGEGAVTHSHERQAVLKALKAKGVVLAINSKNDPANVNWRGGTLADADFVCAVIGWEPKVHGMNRIQAALNLKMKDYVFIDDREDEREMVRLTYPDVLCLDPLDAATWRRFARWEHVLEAEPGMDRTKMYQEREQRKVFIKEEVSSDEERASLFASLALKLTISRAQPNDLKRVAELINRTNQFNLQGSRTSFKEVSEWHASADHMILLGQTSDRFGDMGTTCVAVVRCDALAMHVRCFVLSCRVFGYGIERGVMNHLKQLAQRRGVQQVIGRHVSTPQNGPCKSFLADNGFVRAGEDWMLDLPGAATPDPEWLSVAVRTTG